MSQSNKTISVIVPVFNEERNIAIFYAALKPILSALPERHELLFVDDGSQDKTVEELRRLTLNDDCVRYIELSRNFGKEVALSAGINDCRGAVGIMIDADLQHPVELLPEFVAKWRAGAEVVVGVRRNAADGGFLRRIGTFFYNRLMKNVSDTPFVPGSTDYRLLDRLVIDEFNRFTERGRLTRALIDWLGFRRDYVYFDAVSRQHGRSRYGVLKLTKLAMSNLVAHSLLPLKLAGYLGLAITPVAGSLGLFIFVEKYLLHDPFEMHFSGPAMLAVVLLFLIGIVLICLGLVALYVANIHAEVVNRPLYVVRRRSCQQQSAERWPITNIMERQTERT
ncbi:MAG: glycosyltransferase family 2 protein [Patescibacteria group bacterium]